jgi:GT2 family glycosyltransferase
MVWLTPSSGYLTALTGGGKLMNLSSLSRQTGQQSVSVIIPNLNSGLIDKTLESLFAQTAFDAIAEILVIGLDQPGLVVEREPVRFVCTHGPVTAPVARNIGIREAKGTILAFIDADCMADAAWLETLLSAQGQGHGVVGGSVSLEVENYWQLCYNLTMFHEFLPSTPSGERANLGTLNLCVTLEVVERVGLFDEQLVRGQDTEWTLRMRRHGYQLYFVPEAVVRHLPEASGVSQIVRLWYRSGFFNARIRRRYQDIIAAPRFLDKPFLMVLLSPIIGSLVTARIFASDPGLLRHVHTLPVVFLTKVAWCLGASRPAL